MTSVLEYTSQNNKELNKKPKKQRMALCLTPAIIDRTMIDSLIFSFTGLAKYSLLTEGKCHIGKHPRVITNVDLV